MTRVIQKKRERKERWTNTHTFNFTFSFAKRSAVEYCTHLYRTTTIANSMLTLFFFPFQCGVCYCTWTSIILFSLLSLCFFLLFCYLNSFRLSFFSFASTAMYNVLRLFALMLFERKKMNKSRMLLIYFLHTKRCHAAYTCVHDIAAFKDSQTNRWTNRDWMEQGNNNNNKTIENWQFYGVKLPHSGYLVFESHECCEYYV